MKTKKETVKGYVTDCFNYDPCPLCYGCRNYGVFNKCVNRCGGDLKTNTCTNTKLHNEKNFAKMIYRPKPYEVIENYKYKE